MTETNSNLIPVTKSTINNESVQTVNARELHQFLESKRQFSNWITYQIDRYDFVENQDFICFTNNVTCPPQVDYLISLDMAKILAATTKNEKGRHLLRHILRNTVLTPEELLSMLGDIDLPDVDDLYIYAIREVETGNLKIGISKNPHARLRQLQVGNSNKLEIAAIQEAPNRFADEQYFHREASKYRIHGEWFTSSAIGVMQ